MLGVLFLERAPLELADVPAGLLTWLWVVGSLSAVCSLLWLLLRLGRSKAPPLPASFQALMVGSLAGYLVLLGVRAPDILAAIAGEYDGAPVWRVLAGEAALTVGAGCAFTAALLPFLRNALSLSGRRIMGVARLSFKEAVRRRILYVFCFLILVLLFINWFVQAKPENQLQSYVEIVFSAMTPLLLFSAALVSAFSIPTDIKQQTIHTVLTKPVERFEIVLGRFLGYVALMTLILLVMSVASLFYVLRGVTPEAAAESLKARQTIYGTLTFEKVENEYTENEAARSTTGEHSPKEWDYHEYIVGQDERNPREPVMYAVWTFRDLPRSLAKQETVRCEFNFDIYRQNKGQENRGVACSFFFQTRNWKKTQQTRQAYKDRRVASGAGVDLTPEVDNPLSKEFGYYEVQGKDVRNLHTLEVTIPAGVIANALEEPAEGVSERTPPLTVRVRCGSPGQMVGMARYSLYLRGDGPDDEVDTVGFALNFFKASAGLWMRLVLVIAVSVSVSTELGGIISFLCVMLYYVGGVGRNFIKDLAENALGMSGPASSAYRLFTRTTHSAPLPDSTVSTVAEAADKAYQGLTWLLLQVLPDLDRFTFTDRLANGFSVGVFGQDLLPGLLLLLGYLVPWALLSFYLIRNREIAGAT